MIFIEKSKLIHGTKYDYSKVHYNNNKTPVIIICSIHGDFTQIPKNHTNGSGCPKCAIYFKANKLRENKENFVSKANLIHSNRYDYSNVFYETTHKKIEIICNKHGSYFQTPAHHLKGSGCPKCVNKNVTTEDFIIKARKVHGNKFSYDNVIYINQNELININCPIHGVFNQKPKDHLRGVNCPFCYDSKGENKIKDLLDNSKIGYIRNKTFDGCEHKAKLKYDFYLPELNILIEFDGIQHFKPISYFGGKKEFNDLKIRDDIKNKYAKINSIKLIRIKYNENVENKLNYIIMKDK